MMYRFAPACRGALVTFLFLALRAFGDARLIGRVCEEQSGAVTLVNPYGTRRRLRLPNGEQLPRIC